MSLFRKIKEACRSKKSRSRLGARKRTTRTRMETLEKRELFAADFRSFDGTGNNVLHPQWGSTDESYLRIAPAEYADGKSAPAGADRASARLISNLVAAQSEGLATDERGLSAFIYAWGQFLDHDLDLTMSADPAQSFPIKIPQGDPSFDPKGTGTQTMSLSRSAYDPATGTTNPRQQLNYITAYVDGSMVYGSDQATADSLRTFTGGKLKTSAGNLLPMADGMFQAGDIRVNENPELTAMHTLFLREHNRVADQLSKANPTWNDDRLYQEARRIVIGEIQAITYNEFLPALLGQQALRPYKGYNANVNPGITNEFASAAYRLGHSMLGDDIEFLDNQGNETRDPVALRDAFFNPAIVQEEGIDTIMKYLASDNANAIDTRLIDEVRNFLFGPPGSGGLDLAALNIQRGRDHGLADYNDTRRAYGLPPVKSFAEITKNPETQASLKAAYGTVDKIDLWVGGLAEDHVPGSAVGPLFQRIIADQFTRLRDGDRFWYERDLKGATLDQVRRTTLADVIKRNTTTNNLQENVFFFRTSLSGRVVQDMNRNGKVDPRDPGLAGWSVKLVDADGVDVATTKTDREGRYRFKDIDLGQYQVVFAPPANNAPSGAKPITRNVSVTRGGEIQGFDLAVAPANNLAPPISVALQGESRNRLR